MNLAAHICLLEILSCTTLQHRLVSLYRAAYYQIFYKK